MATGDGADVLVKRLHISGLTPNFSREALRERLESYGRVLDLIGCDDSFTNGVGQRRPYAFATIETTQPQLARCLNTLSGVDDKQCAFACSDGAGDFVREVHVPWGINQIEYVVLTIKLVVHLDGMALNGDPALALEIHIIEYLLLKVLPRDGLCRLQQAVSQGTLPMVDMGYNAKVTYMLHLDYKDTTKTGK